MSATYLAINRVVKILIDLRMCRRKPLDHYLFLRWYYPDQVYGNFFPTGIVSAFFSNS